MLYVPGLIAIIIFYLLILLVGFWAARKSRKRTADTTESEEVMLAGRNIGLVVGIFTMTATQISYVSQSVNHQFRPETRKMLYVPGLIAIIIFYLLILLVGFWAARKSRKRTADTTESEEVMLAGRNIGLVVGIFTMTGSWGLWMILLQSTMVLWGWTPVKSYMD
ncbi:hypothetical protein AHF37_08559, partial [Paragonimus kellicotti]